jgi:hypothetical protein
MPKIGQCIDKYKTLQTATSNGLTITLLQGSLHSNTAILTKQKVITRILFRGAMMEVLPRESQVESKTWYQLLNSLLSCQQCLETSTGSQYKV